MNGFEILRCTVCDKWFEGEKRFFFDYFKVKHFHEWRKEFVEVVEA